MVDKKSSQLQKYVPIPTHHKRHLVHAEIFYSVAQDVFLGKLSYLSYIFSSVEQILISNFDETLISKISSQIISSSCQVLYLRRVY